MRTKGKTVQFKREDVKLEGKILDKEFKPIRKRVKKMLQKGSEEKRLEQYRKKEMQSQIYNKQEKNCSIWLEQNLAPRKTSVIMLVIEHKTKTRAWKEVRGLPENSQCRLCKEKRETVQYLLAGCKILASSEYLVRHNRARMVMAVAWVKE